MRLVKVTEPKRLVCVNCAFIFYQDPKVVAGTIFTYDGGIALLKRGVEPALHRRLPAKAMAAGEGLNSSCVKTLAKE